MAFEIHDQEAHNLRLEAMRLLKEAQEIDGLEPIVVVHEHKAGASCYMGWKRVSDDMEEKQRWAEDLISEVSGGIKVEREHDEYVVFHDEIELHEICGCDPRCEEALNIMTFGSGAKP